MASYTHIARKYMFLRLRTLEKRPLRPFIAIIGEWLFIQPLTNPDTHTQKKRQRAAHSNS